MGGEQVQAPAPHSVWPMEVSVRLYVHHGWTCPPAVHNTRGTDLAGHVPESLVLG